MNFVSLIACQASCKHLKQLHFKQRIIKRVLDKSKNKIVTQLKFVRLRGRKKKNSKISPKTSRENRGRVGAWLCVCVNKRNFSWKVAINERDYFYFPLPQHENRKKKLCNLCFSIFFRARSLNRSLPSREVAAQKAHRRAAARTINSRKCETLFPKNRKIKSV